LGDIGGNRRLLGDYEGLGHGAAIELSRGVFASQSSLPAPSKAGKSLAWPNLTKYFPGNCLTRRFNSNCNNVDETIELGNLLLTEILSIDVSVASIAS